MPQRRRQTQGLLHRRAPGHAAGVGQLNSFRQTRAPGCEQDPEWKGAGRRQRFARHCVRNSPPPGVVKLDGGHAGGRTNTGIVDKKLDPESFGDLVLLRDLAAPVQRQRRGAQGGGRKNKDEMIGVILQQQAEAISWAQAQRLEVAC